MFSKLSLNVLASEPTPISVIIKIRKKNSPNQIAARAISDTFNKFDGIQKIKTIFECHIYELKCIIQQSALNLQ